jgi:hypothetical protein
MITVDDAIGIAIATEGGELAVNRDHIIERSYGWVIFPNSKEYIEIGDCESQLIGSGGVLVLKDSGKAIQFGSAFSVEKNIEIYESGYLDHDNWDIVITSVVDEHQAVDQILALGATYVIPEEESGILWKIPKSYSRKRIKEIVRKPPIRLNIGPIYFNFDVVEGLKKKRSFDYRIEPNQGYENVP